MAGERFRGWRVRSEAAHGDDRDLEGVSDAGRASSRRAAARIVFRGPEVRRLTAEQFGDAIGAITGDWNVYQPLPRRRWPGQLLRGRRPDAIHANGKRPPTRWRARSVDRFGTRYSRRALRLRRRFRRSNWSTENGWRTGCFGAPETCWGNCLLRRRLSSSRRSIRAADEPGHRPRRERLLPCSISISPERLGSGSSCRTPIQQPSTKLRRCGCAESWSTRGHYATPLTSLTPLDESALRVASGPVVLDDATFASGVRVKTPSRLVYDVSGRGFTRLRGVAGLENTSALAQGETILGRFLIFGTEPDMDRLVPPAPGTPLPPGPRLTTATQVVDRLYWYALGRGPSAEERTIALAALTDSTRARRMSAEGLADLLWAVMMKPEFQLIF